MQPIKVRAYDPVTNQMITPAVEINPQVAEPAFVLNLFPDGPPHNIRKMIFMLWTGLTDKNGIEIYAGDIVRKSKELHIAGEIVAHKGEFEDDAFIELVNGSFRLNKLGNKSKHYYGVISYSENTQPETLEVIGNIHMNPELLK